MKALARVHGIHVHPRRVRVLCDRFCQLLPDGARVLDVGSGDGWLARLLMNERPDLAITGIDVLVRDQTHISVAPFDGVTIPYADGSFDAVLFVDVLHHTTDPMVLLREARRVTRNTLVIKDHPCESFVSAGVLRFMDWVSNKKHGVVLPYNYWSRQQWLDAFQELGLTTHTWMKDLKLYPGAADWVFGRSLQFIVRVDVEGTTRGDLAARRSPTTGREISSPMSMNNPS